MIISIQTNFFYRKIDNGSCLKSKTKNFDRIRKSVHFDPHSPIEIRSNTSSPSSIHNNYRPLVTITSSSLSTRNRNNDNDICRKKNYVETVEEKNKFDISRGTIIATTPLTTNAFHRSFSLSSSPLSKEEKNNNRRHRQEKKVNVDEPNCTTTGQLTTATTHFHCNTNIDTVSFNDNRKTISPTKEPTNNSNTSMMHERCLFSLSLSLSCPFHIFF